MVFSKGAALAALSSLMTFTQPAFTSSNGQLPLLKDFDETGTLGALYQPNSASARSRIAVYVMHAEQDYTAFVACTELPKRGFTTFCANNEASKYGYMSDLNFEDMMAEINTGMAWLRNLTDIDKIVILGHSGGGAMMAAYQNIAENGVSACNGAEKIYPCSDAMANLEPADGLMLLDANYGLSTMALLSLNPAIEDETDASKLNQSLSVYNPANGFNNNTQSNYTADFKHRFQQGVVARNNCILQYAQKRLKALEAGKGMFGDDEPLTIPASLYIGFNNLFFAQDTRYLHHTTYSWPLLRKNGTTTGALKTTIRRFLSTFAIRVTDKFNIKADNIEGIGYASSQTAPHASVQGIRVPLLTMGMTGHYEYLNAEKLHLNAISNDTAIAFVEGAQHTINTCTECESYPGEFGDTIVTCFDYVAEWLAKPGCFI
ncbi:hypothetical protein BDV32DRAFT_141464 [Aspergillus pseudonomiae]|uniref:Uncharacterized protein n=1 Tax=Aspergillus pseudonomiae TaxID=1506151 RepID=A0A5N7DEJ9_9EURO|nr:uncharacterized protein BDV37DRAFT_293566 [Aspergillus pseudonomiae]KAB8256168.1 hypothetical protein BDV32DRAFT_141464 [Aspergillus pseudonomiae]KAE8404886.1 hypothetical protein BDV37DRAFT_293566 [Aspergillus pseudonomiae]